MRFQTRYLLIGLLGATIVASPALAQDEPTEGQKDKPGRKRQKQAEAPQADMGTPKLELSSMEWDFGDKWYGEEAESEITLKNVGDGPLHINKVTSSCGCTVAKPLGAQTWNGMVIKPGAEQIMKLSYNTKKVRPKVSQAITITSDDPVMGTARIQVKGSIKQLFDMLPAARITFTQMEPDTVQTKELTLKCNLEGEKVTLTVQPLPEQTPFDVKLETVIEGVEYKLIATSKPPLKLGANAAQVILDTSHERYSSLTVPISAYIAPRVQVSPSTLYVPREGGASIQRYVRVRYQTSKPIEVTDVSVVGDAVKAELIPPRTTPHPKATIAMHEIRVTLPPASEFPTEGAEITVRTDDTDPQYQEFTIKVMLQPEARQSATARPATDDDEEDAAGTGAEKKPGAKGGKKKAGGKKAETEETPGAKDDH